jgi:hypothetical protein
MSELINVQLNAVELTKNMDLLIGTDAVPKDYVDSLVTEQDTISKNYVDSQITNLIFDAPNNLNTFKDVADAINNNDKFSSDITTEIASEIVNRMQEDDLIKNQLDTEKADRIQLGDKLTTDLDTERNERMLENFEIKQDITKETQERNSEINDLQVSKFDKSLKFQKNDDGNFKVQETAYLYIGNNWRITTRDTNAEKRLFFEYTLDGLFWNVGTPYIRSAPSLIVTLDTIIPLGIAKRFYITVEINNHKYNLSTNANNQPSYLSENYPIGDSSNPYTGLPEEKTFSLQNIEGFDEDPVYIITNEINPNFGDFWYNVNDELTENPHNALFGNSIPAANWFILSNIILTSSYSFKANMRLISFGNKYIGYNSSNFIDSDSYVKSIMTNAENSLELTFTTV